MVLPVISMESKGGQLVACIWLEGEPLASVS